jgi:MFS family permease
LIIVPLAANYGRRPIFFFSNIVCFISCIWQARASSYGSFMAARVLDGIGAAANETLGPMLVADVFFLHERGLFNGAYFFALFCSCAMGPIIGGYIASSAGGWRVSNS